MGVGKPKVVNAPGFLLLHLDDGNFQSLMRKSRPYRLELGYTRTMMGFLLFNPHPASVAMVGLGGGSLAKHCYRHLRNSAITVVEIDPAVIALRDLFHVPPDDGRFRVICSDGADYVARQKSTLAALLVDGFDKRGQVPQLCTQSFYDACHAALDDNGVLVVNILGADPGIETYLARIRHSFGHGVMVAQSEDCDNKIVFAVKGPAFHLPDSELLARARLLSTQHGLKFQPVAAQLMESRRLK